MIAWDLCEPAPPARLVAGFGVFNAIAAVDEAGRMKGLEVERVLPSWNGLGWDQQGIFGADWLGECARVGVREQVIWHNVADKTLWPTGTHGAEWHFVTSAMLGGEIGLPASFAAGLYGLPGVRAVYTHQRSELEEHDIDRSITHFTFVPTLSAYAVVRWTPPRSRVGLHVDAELPVVNPVRETENYPHRFAGIGLDFRV